jgi:hypothetical protein
MKRKYVSPYIDNKRYIINDPQGQFFSVQPCIGNEALDGMWYYSMGYFPSKELTMEALDKQLIKQGYTLLTQEQLDKLTILF